MDLIKEIIKTLERINLESKSMSKNYLKIFDNVEYLLDIFYDIGTHNITFNEEQCKTIGRLIGLCAPAIGYWSDIVEDSFEEGNVLVYYRKIRSGLEYMFDICGDFLDDNGIPLKDNVFQIIKNDINGEDNFHDRLKDYVQSSYYSLARKEDILNCKDNAPESHVWWKW